MWPSRHSGTSLIAFLVSIAAVSIPTLDPLHAEEDKSPSDTETLEQMRKEMEDLKEQVRALREQVESLQKAQGESPIKAELPPPPAPSETPIPPPLPPQARPTGAGLLNPAISAVFQGIAGFSVNHNRDDDGFSLSEAEVGLQAAVDPYAKVDLFLTFDAEGDAGVEEGFVTFTAMPGGLAARAGRFKNSFGKWNELHDHVFFSVDRPEALTNTFGEEGLTSDGVSLNWLVPGTGSVYLETVTEVGSTSNDVSFNARRRDLLYLQRVAAVFTLSDNATLGTGLTGVKGIGGPSDQLLDDIDDAGLTGTVEPANDLSSNVFGADLTYKWKPVQFNTYRSFTSQTEVLESRRRVQV